MYIIFLIINSYTLRYIYENPFLEFYWTILPILLLLFLILPRLFLLYIRDEGQLHHFSKTKITGFQWGWEYEFHELNCGNQISFLRYGLKEKQLELGEIRNLTVDQPLVLPIGLPHRLYVTSRDVIHRFRLPSCGVKIDAIVSRLNGITTELTSPGLIPGLCRELCGVGHAFIPIIVYGVPWEDYWSYASPSKEDLYPTLNRAPTDLEENLDQKPDLWFYVTIRVGITLIVTGGVIFYKGF